MVTRPLSAMPVPTNDVFTGVLGLPLRLGCHSPSAASSSLPSNSSSTWFICRVSTWKLDAGTSAFIPLIGAILELPSPEASCEFSIATGNGMADWFRTD